MSTPIDPKPDALLSSADCVWSEFLSVMDTLAPDICVAFLLHEVFDASYDSIARLTGDPPETCREQVEHARKHALTCMHRICKRESAMLQ